jgi:hypothetical protein
MWIEPPTTAPVDSSHDRDHVVRRSPDLARASTAGLKGVPRQQAEHGDLSGRKEWLGQEAGHNRESRRAGMPIYGQIMHDQTSENDADGQWPYACDELPGPQPS